MEGDLTLEEAFFVFQFSVMAKGTDLIFIL